MTQLNSQEWARHRVHDGHIVDRCDDLETAYEQIIARCYNRKKDGSLGYWKHSSFTHHDFEVMRRLIFDVPPEPFSGGCWADRMC